ncbi:hypothetical protein ACLB1O_21600 [Escherichia coli]
MLGAGVVVLIDQLSAKRTSSTGLAYSVLYCSAVRDHRALPAPCAGRTPAFQQHVDKLEQGDREGLQDGPKSCLKRLPLNTGAAC